MDFRTYEDIEQWILPHRPEDLFNPHKVSIIAQVTTKGFFKKLQAESVSYH